VRESCSIAAHASRDLIARQKTRHRHRGSQIILCGIIHPMIARGHVPAGLLPGNPLLQLENALPLPSLYRAIHRQSPIPRTHTLLRNADSMDFGKTLARSLVANTDHDRAVIIVVLMASGVFEALPHNRQSARHFPLRIFGNVLLPAGDVTIDACENSSQIC